MAKVKMVKKLSDKGYPYHNFHYKTAHEEADVKEKKKFPRGYEKLKHIEKKLQKNELMGTNKRSGKIEVEKKFNRYEKEIAYHEKEEHKNLKRLEKKNKSR